MAATARELDLLGARAWPPLEEMRLDDWRIRFAGGVTRRANSVLPLGPLDGSRLDAAELARRVARVERAYGDRGLPPRFQITASAWPAELERELDRRGYAEAGATLVSTAPVRAGARPARELTVRSEPSAAWFDTWWSVDGRGGPEQALVARAILRRIESRALFVECRDGAAVASVGLGVLDGAWLGIYCMATLPATRRRGYARAVLSTLLAAAAARGIARAHLSVTEENVAARALYAAAGFEDRQRYSYFTG